MRSKSIFSLLLCAAALLLSACDSLPSLPSLPAPPPPPKPIKIIAFGQGTLSNAQYGQYNTAQLKLMAMRAAKLDAYRNLAEQVYGFRLTGSTTISTFASQRDYVRVQIDAYVRGARVVEVRQLPDGIYEAQVEAELPADIYKCLQRGECPEPPRPSPDCSEGCLTAPPACSGIGCTPASGATLNWSPTR